MSCMEHLCIGCGHIELNNILRMTESCPKCGGTRWGSICDEDLPVREDDDSEEEKDDE